MVGTIIVCHGDEKGLRLPPRVAPIQVVLVPIFKTDEDKIRITQELGDLVQTLEAHGVRVKFDERDNLSPGWKFNEWEIKGVPIRIEMGPRDLEKSEVVVARRDTSEKNSMPMADLASAIPDLLEEIQANMLKQAEEFLNSSIHEADSVEEMKKILDEKGGFVKAAWAGSSDDEKIIQDKTKATIRIISDEPLSKKGTCILTGKETDQLVYFAKAY